MAFFSSTFQQSFPRFARTVSAFTPLRCGALFLFLIKLNLGPMVHVSRMLIGAPLALRIRCCVQNRGCRARARTPTATRSPRPTRPSPSSGPRSQSSATSLSATPSVRQPQLRHDWLILDSSFDIIGSSLTHPCLRCLRSGSLSFDMISAFFFNFNFLG